MPKPRIAVCPGCDEIWSLESLVAAVYPTAGPDAEPLFVDGMMAACDDCDRLFQIQDGQPVEIELGDLDPAQRRWLYDQRRATRR